MIEVEDAKTIHNVTQHEIRDKALILIKDEQEFSLVDGNELTASGVLIEVLALFLLAYVYGSVYSYR